MDVTKTSTSVWQGRTYGEYSLTYFMISASNPNSTAKYQTAAKNCHMLVPRDMIMHLRELRAWRRLKLRELPALITTPWIRMVLMLVISLAAVYHPSSVIGTVAPTQPASIEDPHFSNGIDICLFFFINSPC